MKLRIDFEVCTGHGRCYALAPELFEPDDYGHAALVVEDVPDDLAEKARLAVANCPERAISVDD